MWQPSFIEVLELNADFRLVDFSQGSNIQAKKIYLLGLGLGLGWHPDPNPEPKSIYI